jgi:hypothetical protein
MPAYVAKLLNSQIKKRGKLVEERYAAEVCDATAAE